MSPQTNPAARRQQLAKTITAEEKILAGLTHARTQASEALTQSQETLNRARNELQDAKNLSAQSEATFRAATEAVSQQYGKIQRLKSDMVSVSPGEISGTLINR
jgi:predicted  nucleic acid-binding Zn-ribbon protein